MKKLLFISILLISSLMLYSQNSRHYQYFEYQLGVTGSKYFGKVDDSTPKTWFGKNTIGLNLGGRYVMSKHLSFSAQFNPMLMSKKVEDSWKYAGFMGELFVRAEYYPIKLIYVYGGFGGVCRTPLYTNENFAVMGMILSGIGYRHNNKLWSQCIDVGARYTTTGNLYYLIELKAIKRIGEGIYNRHGLIIK